MDKRRSRTRMNRKKEKKFNWTTVVKLVLLFGVILIATFFSLLNIGSNNILNNVYINGIAVSSLSTEEARNKIQPILEEKLNTEITIKFENYETTILPEEIDFSYNLPSALEKAYGVGRTGNIITNNLKILASLFVKTNIEAPITYNTDKLDKNLTKDLIISAIDKQNSVIELPVSLSQPENIDIAKIHKEIYSEPQNASVTKEPYSITVEKQGVDFAISIEEANQIISSSDSNEFSIPLVYTNAEITVADLGEDIFANTLSSSTTKYDSTNTNRAINLEIAVNKINGTVLAPGEVFSFNQVVGERTAKSGFKEAVIYSDGELDYGLGGGICQISSNLYNTVLQANLEIVERKNHSMTVNYLPVGRDATVSYGSVDFKFKNSRNYPIKIVATINSGVITISICGVKEENDYTVDIVTDVIQKEDFEIVYENSTSIPKGTESIKQTGKYGYKTSTYRVLYQNGKVVSKTLLSTDTYKPLEQIVLVNK